ncbi:MAG: hypothetical protein NTV21_17975 [Planctomycetota bacterium]|nr:hypothetical protein [Planctomycetota bacterium]
MKALVLWMLLQAPAVPTQVAPQPEPAPKAAVQPFAGTLREGRLELARLSKAEKHEEARALAAALAAKPDFDAQPEAERAELLYAIGVAHGRALQIPEAVESFHRARGLAGSSELGRAAAYNAGTYLLLGAEQVREQIPEIRDKLKLPPLDPAQSPALAAPGGAGAGEEAPDPLEIARQAYLAARLELLAAWRGDSASSDVRANLELCVRRLRELDELERKREEQQQEQQNEKQDPNQKQDPQEGDQQQDKDKQDPQQQDQKQDPKDPQQDDANKDGEKNEPKPQDEKKPDESEPKKDPGAQADEAKKEERPLSAEEMQRLLQQLQQIDEKAKEIEALLRDRRRQPVKKDW